MFILFMQIPPVLLDVSCASLCHEASVTAEIRGYISKHSRRRLSHHSSPSSLRAAIKLFLPPFTRCWISCEPTCAWRCSGSGGSPMWTVSTCTAFLTASSTGFSGVTARACGAASPTAGSRVTRSKATPRSNPSRRRFSAKQRRLQTCS